MPIDPSTAFVSYSREDLEFVLRLATDLKAKGAKVWMDKLDIRLGQRWDTEVETAVEQCASMIVILSPAAVSSEKVKNEFIVALDEGKVVIPVLFCDCKIPLQLRRLQYTDFRNDYAVGLDELTDSLHGERDVAPNGPDTESSELDQLEQQRIAEQQAQLEQERERIAAQQARLDEERKKAAEEKASLEQLQLKYKAAEETSRQAELDRLAIAAEKSRLERQRKRIAMEQARLDEERKKADRNATRARQPKPSRAGVAVRGAKSVSAEEPKAPRNWHVSDGFIASILRRGTGYFSPKWWAEWRAKFRREETWIQDPTRPGFWIMLLVIFGGMMLPMLPALLALIIEKAHSLLHR